MSIASLDQVKSMLRSMLGVTDRGIAKAQNDAKEAAEKATDATEKASDATEKASEATEKASEALGLANAAKDGVASKMDATNPVGTGSFSMGRRAGSLTGPNSHAEGVTTTASGYVSHAEGNSTTASGHCSHAEGDSTTASGQRSHAEGATTTASGYVSHAEGFQTRALGECQHVQGRYNIEDSDGAYAHIVGNGHTTEDFRSVRSNAHTLDWDGNAWFAGDVYVGGSSQAEGEKLVKQSQLPTTDELVSAVIAKLPVYGGETA